MLLALLAGCVQIEGGVPTATPALAPEERPTATLPPLPTSAAVAERLAERNSTWILALATFPDSLFPYQYSATEQRIAAPITELLFPAPVLTLNYGYTVTGILERLPTFENGDVQVQTATVYLDDFGAITSTVTTLPTETQQLIVTFRWNPELRWSDGTPLTADDSVFAYELARATTPGEQARTILAQTIAYEQVDTHTTRAVLRPDFTGPTYVLSVWTPLPRHVLGTIPPEQVRASDFATRPISYGPYMFEQQTEGEIRLVRNPYFPDPTPAAERIQFLRSSNLEFLQSALQTGNLDAFFLERATAEQIREIQRGARDGIRIAVLPGTAWEHIDFNLDVPTLQDIRIRRAIAFGTNRQRMTDELTGGYAPVLNSWVMPQEFEAAPPTQLTRYPYDPDEARRLLDETGYVDPDGDGLRVNEEGITLTLQLITTENTPVRQRIAELFQADMRAIGIDLEVETLPTDEFFAEDGPLFLRQFELALFGWLAGPEPGGLQLWTCNAVPSERNNFTGNNVAGWCFRDADRAIRLADTSFDPELRRTAYLTQQQLWTQELPALPLFQRVQALVTAPGVQGPQPDPHAPLTWNLRNWQRSS